MTREAEISTGKKSGLGRLHTTRIRNTTLHYSVVSLLESLILPLETFVENLKALKAYKLENQCNMKEYL